MDNSITVSKKQLIETLEANQALHMEKVERAQTNYRDRLIVELMTRLEDAKSGRPIDVSVIARMPVPRSYAAEYEQALAELEWHTGDTVELTSRDFKRFVMDDWEWAAQWAGTTQVYLAE